jgi:hypothetical protein
MMVGVVTDVSVECKPKALVISPCHHQKTSGYGRVLLQGFPVPLCLPCLSLIKRKKDESIGKERQERVVLDSEPSALWLP